MKRLSLWGAALFAALSVPWLAWADRVGEAGYGHGQMWGHGWGGWIFGPSGLPDADRPIPWPIPWPFTRTALSSATPRRPPGAGDSMLFFLRRHGRNTRGRGAGPRENSILSPDFSP